MRLLTTSLALLTLTTFAAAQVAVGPLVQERGYPEHLVHVWSGDGVPGGPDARVKVLTGPAGGWGAPITPAQFAAAEAGPQAMVLDTWAWGNKTLTTHPGSQWIAPALAWGGGAPAASALFATEFEVPTNIFTATMDFHFVADDDLGAGSVAGVYLNGEAVPYTNATAAWGDQYDRSGLVVHQQLKPGKNVLFVYVINTGGAGGVLFDAIVRVNSPRPDECSQARELYLDDNLSSTKGLTTSSEASSCAILNDAWHYFVPHESGTLSVNVNSISGLTPVLAVYDGSCGALNELSCQAGPFAGGQVSWTGPVKAGKPLLVRVGGATAATGPFRVRLELTASASALVYPDNGHAYELSPGTMDMPAARLWAQSKGGYLVAMSDAAENAWVANKLPGGSIWLGASDELSEGTWLWDSGEPFVYSSWGAGEPNDNPACNGEDYVEMDGAGTWRDYPSGVSPCGNTLRRALVEIPSTSLALVTDLGGACGPDELKPGLYSEPHVIGKTISMGIFDAGPFGIVFLSKSPKPSTPTPLGACTVHLDLGMSIPVEGFIANEYGSGSVQVVIPNDPGLIGIVEIWQVQVLTDVTVPSYSNGIEVQLGT